jgi:hypothetical protein
MIGAADDSTIDKGAMEAMTSTKRLGSVPQSFLNVAFIFALVLAGVCLVFSAVYLYVYLKGTMTGIDSMSQALEKNPAVGAIEVMINGRLVMARLSLLSCGIFVGVSFGFLGFALCLLGIKESIDVDLETDTYKAKFARMSPGVLIIICSSILTGVCATRETPFWYEKTADPSLSRQQKGDPSDPGSKEQNESDGRNVPARSKEFLKPTP